MASGRKDNKGRALYKGESQRTDGTYQYSWLDCSKKRHYIYARTLMELRNKEKSVERDILDGISTTDAKLTLNELFKMFMATKSNIRPTTRTYYNILWKSNVELSFIGTSKIEDIRQVHLEQFYNELSKKGLKYGTIKLLNVLISSSLEMAVDNDYIRKNPAKKALSKLKNDKAEKIPLTEDEVKRLLDFCANHITQGTSYSNYIPFINIAIGTCMRVGELTGLQWSDIDLKNRTINVDKQLLYKDYGDGSKFHISKPKTKAGTRIIPMTERVYRSFVEIKKHNLSSALHCEANIEGYKDFVFINGAGQPYAAAQVNAFLGNLERAYNKENPDEAIHHLSAHILRHTGCTQYAARGIDIKALQEIMGHSDASVTLNIYNHSSLERTQAELKRIDNVVNM